MGQILGIHTVKNLVICVFLSKICNYNILTVRCGYRIMLVSKETNFFLIILFLVKKTLTFFEVKLHLELKKIMNINIVSNLHSKSLHYLLNKKI
jgi:hypothetical protein